MPHLQLKDRTVLAVTGPDRQHFLQGMLTNDIGLVKNNALLYACFLSPQGKFLTDVFLQAQSNNWGDDTWLLDVEADYAKTFMQQLNMFKLRANVQIVPTDLAVWVGWPYDCDAPPNTYPDPRLAALGWRAIGGNFEANTDSESYHTHHIALGVPCGARDLKRGLTALLEAGLDKFNAISFTKGCYVGQELTARMHYKSLAKKALLPVRYDGQILERGAAVRNQMGVAVGEVASAVPGLALAYLKLDALSDVLMVDNIQIELSNKNV